MAEHTTGGQGYHLFEASPTHYTRCSPCPEIFALENSTFTVDRLYSPAGFEPGIAAGERTLSDPTLSGRCLMGLGVGEVKKMKVEQGQYMTCVIMFNNFTVQSSATLLTAV